MKKQNTVHKAGNSVFEQVVILRQSGMFGRYNHLCEMRTILSKGGKRIERLVWCHLTQHQILFISFTNTL